MRKIIMSKKFFWKKNFLIFIAAMLLVSACTRQKPDDLVGKGTPVGEVKEFKMTAKQFKFEPSTIEVNKGDRVRLIVADRKSTRLNSSHSAKSRMPSSA